MGLFYYGQRISIASWFHSYFNNAMTKFMINNNLDTRTKNWRVFVKYLYIGYISTVDIFDAVFFLVFICIYPSIRNPFHRIIGR